MSIGNRIYAALSVIVSEVEPSVYTGSADEYIVYNYNEIPVMFGGNKPKVVRCLVQVHWYAPSGTDPETRKAAIKSALCAAGATYPSVENASDIDGLHLVFECEMSGDP